MYAKQGLMLQKEKENIVGSEDTESVWATLQSGNGKKTMIGLCYVPPNDRESDVCHEVSYLRITLAIDILECFIYRVAPPDDQFCSSLAML